MSGKDIHCSSQNVALFVDLLWNIFCLDENKIGALKIEIIIVLSFCPIFRYCDRNIVLWFFASSKVIALYLLCLSLYQFYTSFLDCFFNSYFKKAYAYSGSNSERFNLLLQYGKNTQFDNSPKIISLFGCTNIIFTNCISWLRLYRRGLEIRVG